MRESTLEATCLSADALIDLAWRSRVAFLAGVQDDTGQAIVAGVQPESLKIMSGLHLAPNRMLAGIGAFPRDGYSADPGQGVSMQTPMPSTVKDSDDNPAERVRLRYDPASATIRIGSRRKPVIAGSARCGFDKIHEQLRIEVEGQAAMGRKVAEATGGDGARAFELMLVAYERNGCEPGLLVVPLDTRDRQAIERWWKQAGLPGMPLKPAGRKKRVRKRRYAVQAYRVCWRA